MNVSGDSSQNRKPSVPAPVGSHLARFLFIVDLGTQEKKFGNNPVERKRMVQIGWELVNTNMPTENPGEIPRPFVVSKEYTATFTSEKSNLRKMYNAVMGTKISDEEAKAGIDISILMGKECIVNVINYIGQDQTLKSKPDSVMAAMAGVPVPPLRGEMVDFTIGAPNQFQLFPKIYSWLRYDQKHNSGICASPEFIAECQKWGTTAMQEHEKAKEAWKAANPLPAQGQQQQSAMQPNQQWMQQGQQQQQGTVYNASMGYPQQGQQQQYQQQPQYNQGGPVQQPGFHQQPAYQQPAPPQGQPYQQHPQYPNQQQPAQNPQQQPQRTMNQNQQQPPQQWPGQQQQPPMQQPGFGQQQVPPPQQQGFGAPPQPAFGQPGFGAPVDPDYVPF